MSNKNTVNHKSSKPEHFIISPVTEPFLERMLFSARPVVLAILALLTIVFAYGLTQIKLDSSIEKYIPLEHQFIKNYLVHKEELGSGLSNIKLSVETKKGDIFTKEYMATLQRINDEIFFIKGVDRSALKSLWTPNVRWTEVTEEGFQGGPVIPATYDGSEQSLNALRENVLKSGQVGRLVANNFSSTIIDIPLVEIDPDTGEKLDYQAFSNALETKVRDAFSSDDITVYMTGTPKKLADLLDGVKSIVWFFIAAIIFTAILLFMYSRCIRGTLIPIVASLVAVVWQLGALALMGFTIDLYSVLVPFLVFAIGISHGVQIISGIAIEIGRAHV